MLNNLHQTQQKYGGASKVIDSWLAERQTLIVQFCHLVKDSPKDKVNLVLPDQQQVIEFCQILMDYLSAGHFEIFDEIASQCKINGGASQALAKALFPKIHNTTDLAVNFNDKYTQVEKQSTWIDFDFDLAALGSALDDRFVYEDALIEDLYTKHTETA